MRDARAAATALDTRRKQLSRKDLGGYAGRMARRCPPVETNCPPAETNWMLPSGQRLAEFAWTSGFLVPDLLKSLDPPGAVPHPGREEAR